MPSCVIQTSSDRRGVPLTGSDARKRSGCSGCFFLAGIFLLVLLAGCTTSIVPEKADTITFGVIDVGQGLSQILRQSDRALLFDTGDDSVGCWRDAWRESGSPHIEAVVISHRDLDHTGGLRYLDATVDWSGRLIAGRWEDTAFIRSCCRNWSGPLTIATIAQGDSIYFTEDCSIDCRWPEAQPPAVVPVTDELVNRYSLVLSVNYRNTGVLLTGDIDSAAARSIARNYRAALRADIVVVPHHGSASSNCPLFYGYVRPSTAIISVGENNAYGHPAPSTLTLLADHGIVSRTTSNEGTLYYRTNGYYWEQ